MYFENCYLLVADLGVRISDMENKVTSWPSCVLGKK